MTITGSGLTGATAVKFGGTPASNYDVYSDGDLVAEVPSGATGTDDLTVTFD